MENVALFFSLILPRKMLYVLFKALLQVCMEYATQVSSGKDM